MYIEKLQIHKYRVLEDIEIRFQPPNGETADPETGNVVNIIAGVNGSGKTTLLKAVVEYLHDPCYFEVTKKYGRLFLKRMDLYEPEDCQRTYFFISQKMQNNGKSSVKEKSQLIYMPAELNFSYKHSYFLDLTYEFLRQIRSDQLLGNAEFYIKEFIIAKERMSTESDPEKRSAWAVEEFNKTFLDANLLTRLVNLDANQMNRPVFANPRGELVTIDQLSDGEKQLYGRVIALMMLEPQDSIILIDEPEIALHPAWQQKIMKIYSRIGKNNQFIVATHSPQIIANTPYQNLILLRKNEQGKIEPLYPSEPPTGVDVNSILTEIMGVEELLPLDVLNLRRQYREYVKKGTEDSEEANNVKNKLLKRENNNSQFMQEMRLL